MELDQIIFNNKTFADLLKEIYDNQKKKSKQIESLITELKPLIENIGNATLVVPLIRDYLEMGVKNDDMLIKLGSMLQKIESNTSNDVGGLSEQEKEALLKLNEETRSTDK